MGYAESEAGGARIVPFTEAPLELEAAGIASRAVVVNGVRWALVEYASGVLGDQWCRAGRGLMLTRGTGHRGRAGPTAFACFSSTAPAEPAPRGSEHVPSRT